MWRPHLAALETLYLGGGTPSESPAEMIMKLFSPLTLNTLKEFTIEVNPSSMTSDNIQNWKQLGINRLSIGIQSLVDSNLKNLGRNHNREEALRAIDLACENFNLVCCDLIYGVPDQSLEDLDESIEEFSKKPIKHISAYTLTLPQSHFLFKKLPGPEEGLLQAEFIHKKLHSAGFEHYEASNFARPGFRGMHNCNYWTGNSYLGVGPSAHSFDGRAKRWINFPDLKKYNSALESRNLPILELEELNSQQREIEFFLVRMRTIAGFHLREVEAKFGAEKLAKIRRKLTEFEESGLGQLVENTWFPSFPGIMLSDSLTEKLI